MLRGTGRPTQLPVWVRVESTPLEALMGVEYDMVTSWLRAVELALVTTSPTQPSCVAECRCRRPSAPGRGGPVGRSGGFCGSTSFVSAALGDRLVPCSWRRACMWLNSWVRSSPTKL